LSNTGKDTANQLKALKDIVQGGLEGLQADITPNEFLDVIKKDVQDFILSPKWEEIIGKIPLDRVSALFSNLTTHIKSYNDAYAGSNKPQMDLDLSAIKQIARDIILSLNSSIEKIEKAGQNVDRKQISGTPPLTNRLLNNKMAIVIGINEYESTSIPSLRGAENDAQEIHDILLDNGYKISNKTFLLGSKATYRAITRAISNAYRKKSDYDLILFYYSGHGFVDENKDFFIAPVDIDPDDPYTCGISDDELLRVMDKSKNDSKFVTILDCCYAGKAIEGTKSGDNSQKGVAILEHNFGKFGQSTDTKYESSEPEQKRKMILVSSQVNEEAHEKEFEKGFDNTEHNHHHGIFSFHLIEALRGKCKWPIKEGTVDMGSIFNYINIMKEMKDNDKQIFDFKFEDTSDNFIILATFGEYDKSIKKGIQSFTSDIESKDIRRWIGCAKRLWDLFNPESSELRAHMNNEQIKEVENLKGKLDTNLKKLGDKFATWFTNNMEADVYSIFENHSEGTYKKLANMSYNFSCESVAKATGKERNTLIAVYEYMDESPGTTIQKNELIEKKLRQLNMKGASF
jgi:hypothetical protein